MIVGAAAEGLAKLQEPRAIDELITTGHHVSGEGRQEIAKFLLYFPDPKAQAAADELAVPTDSFKFAKQAAREKGVKGLFPW
jgi:hypothetical protein